jgi:DNA-directed RNA polymerase delta subunit
MPNTQFKSQLERIKEKEQREKEIISMKKAVIREREKTLRKNRLSKQIQKVVMHKLSGRR